MFVRAVHIFESKNPGHVTSVSLQRGSNDWVCVYTGPAVTLSEESRTFKPWIKVNLEFRQNDNNNDDINDNDHDHDGRDDDDDHDNNNNDDNKNKYNNKNNNNIS